MAYATVSDLKDHIGKTLDTDDLVLQQLLDRASDLIDDLCHREIGGFQADAIASARTYSGSGAAVQWMNECVEVTLVEVKDSPTDDTYTAWAAADWVAATGDPKRPNFNRTPYRFLLALPTGDYSRFTSGKYVHRPGFRPIEPPRTEFGVPTVRITARWGYADQVPGPIVQAVIAQASRWFKRGQGAYGDVLSTGELGQMFYQKKLDPDIANMIEGGRFIVPLYHP